MWQIPCLCYPFRDCVCQVGIDYVSTVHILVSRIYIYLANPGEARDCSTNTSITDSFISWLILSLPQLYGAATPKWLERALLVMNTDQGDSKFQMISKSHYWFKSYGGFGGLEVWPNGVVSSIKVQENDSNCNKFCAGPIAKHGR